MFKGVGTALITPFNEDFSVDYVSLKRLVEFQLKSNVDALIVLATTGEAPTIEINEFEEIVSFVMNEVNGRVPVIVGTGTNNPKKVLKLNKIAESLKVDGLLIVNPYYNKSTQNGLVEYYKYISEHTILPIILYNVPSRTGMNITPQTIVKIHSLCPNVIGVKEASGNISQIAELMAIKPDSLNVFSGNDDQTLPIMTLGGCGVISVVSNIFPSEFRELTHLILKERISEAQTINNKLLKIANLLFVETNPIPVKYAAYKLGLCKNYLRLPLIQASKNTENLIDEELSKLGALWWLK